MLKGVKWLFLSMNDAAEGKMAGSSTEQAAKTCWQGIKKPHRLERQ